MLQQLVTESSPYAQSIGLLTMGSSNTFQHAFEQQPSIMVRSVMQLGSITVAA